MQIYHLYKLKIPKKLMIQNVLYTQLKKCHRKKMLTLRIEMNGDVVFHIAGPFSVKTDMFTLY